AAAGGSVDLCLLAASVVRQHAHPAEQKRISLECDEAAGAMPGVACEAGIAFQAITNLVSNALKFTPRGGRVRVRVGASAHRVRVDVADDGPGVPEAERGLLFREHARLSPTPTAGEESHGLGLSIVKQLVEAQGGTVGAEFPPSGGSLFWFDLPAVR
ncbi:MAG TPA: HAMP domain-containing sensor histidine kinase, partial [Opitutus sp.]|nr:HAMP domain-containing sensor histidine kinase [Opitutus sp.]